MSQMKLLNCLSRLQITKNESKYLRNIVHVLVRNNSTKTTKQKTAASVYRTMNVFDRNAKALQRERSARRDDYHLSEYIKEEVGYRTADRVLDIKRVFTNAVELGASRGYVSRHFFPDSVEKVTLCDTSQTHLDKAIVGDGIKFEKRIMDEENIDFPDNSVDLLVSSLALHWVNDLPGCFDKIMKCLKPDGVFMACVFGGDTLMELRQALQLAESERCGGISPHVSPFTRIRDIGGLLTASGFTLQTVDIDTIVIWYPSIWEVMRDVRALGEGNAANNRPLRLPKDVMFAAASIYDEMYGKIPSIWEVMRDVRALGEGNAANNRPLRLPKDVMFAAASIYDEMYGKIPSIWEVMRDVRALGEGNAANNRPLRLPKDVMFAAASIYDEMYGKEIPDRKERGVPATYQIINFLGWKPDPSQPKPIERGTGQVSLKELHRIDQIIDNPKIVELRDEDMK